MVRGRNLNLQEFFSSKIKLTKIMKKIIGYHKDKNLDYQRVMLIKKLIVLEPEWWEDIEVVDYKVIAMDAHLSRVVQSYNH